MFSKVAPGTTLMFVLVTKPDPKVFMGSALMIGTKRECQIAQLETGLRASTEILPL